MDDTEKYITEKRIDHAIKKIELSNQIWTNSYNAWVKIGFQGENRLQVTMGSHHNDSFFELCESTNL